MLLKILHLIPELPLGGAEKVVLSLAKAQKARGHQVRILTTREKGELASAFEESGIPVTNLYFKNRLHPPHLKQLANLIQFWQVQILHAHMYRASITGTVAGILAQTPVIISHIHTSDLRWDNYQQLLTDSFLAHFRDAHIAVCQFVLDFFRRKTHLSKKKIQVIYNAVDPSLRIKMFTREEARKKLKLPADALVAGMVTRLVSEKRPFDFLESFSRIQDASEKIYFVLIGDGPLRLSLENEVKRNKFEARFIITGSLDNAWKYLKAFDVGVLTSNSEGLPLSLLEFLNAGVPMVCSEVGGCSEVLREGQEGFLFESGDVDMLVKRLKMILSNEDLRLKMSEAAQSRIDDNFSIHTQNLKLENIYLDLLQRKTKK